MSMNNKIVSKHGVRVNGDRKVETPPMFSNLILRTHGGYLVESL